MYRVALPLAWSCCWHSSCQKRNVVGSVVGSAGVVRLTEAIVGGSTRLEGALVIVVVVGIAEETRPTPQKKPGEKKLVRDGDGVPALFVGKKDGCNTN